MAAAEVRAVWQRTANRCFVQEDAKRAPKLACCQPSSATSKLVDAGPPSAADDSDHAALNVNHFNWKSSFSNLTPESRWWLHLQPNYGSQKGLTYEQLNASEDEVEILKARDENKACKGDATHFGDENHDSSDYMHYDDKADIIKETPKDRKQEAYTKNSQAFPGLVDIISKYDTVEIDSVGCSVSKQTNDFSLDSDYSWIEVGQAQPWWRTTDRDELASFVSQKSLNHIENCDLPPPQKYLRRHSCADIRDDKIKTASFDRGTKLSRFSDLTVQSMGSLDSGLIHRKEGLSANKGHLYFASDKSSSSYTTVHEDVTEQVFEGDSSKAQLMEALCHSQTRAREAEEAAKQAYAEKEHVISLFFKQASQLYAYKQWFQLLLLENLHIQLKNKDKQISSLFPVAFPWMSFEGAKPRKRKHKFANGKQEMVGKPKGDIGTYAVAFALGLSLVGAGLLLGWTIGWMLPRL